MGPLLDEALELSTQERESWLAGLATTRPEAAGELRRLLELNSELDAEGFLESVQASRRYQDTGEAMMLVCEARQLAGQKVALSDIERAVSDLQISLGPEHSLTREARALVAAVERPARISYRRR